MKILIISDIFPMFNAPGGSQARVYCLMREMAKKHSITLLSTRWPGIDIRPETLKDICKDVIFYDFIKKPVNKDNGLLHRLFGNKSIKRLREIRHLLFEYPEMAQSTFRHSPAYEKELKGLCISDYDLIQVEDTYLAYRLFNIKKQYPHIPIVVDQHNVNALIEKRNMELAKGWRWKLYSYFEWRKMMRYETKIFNTFDLHLTCSEEDKELSLYMAPKAKFEVISNGVDTEFFKKEDVMPEPNSIFFLGSNWPPNVEGILYFHKEILPKVRKVIPDVKFYIVGNFKGNNEIEALGDSRTILTGYVKDVREWMNRASVSIVPLRLGGGTRLKILEALSMEKPIVSTSMGAEGIEVTNGENIVLADNSQDFAEGVIKLLRDEKECQRLGKNGRKLVEAKYDWSVIGNRLLEVYERLTNSK